MDISLGRVLPAGVTDYASPLTGQLPRIGAIGTGGANSALDVPVAGEAGLTGSTGATQNVAESFAQLLSQAVQDVNQLHHSADHEAQRLVAGEPVDIHQVMIGMEKANVAFGLTLQVRNKLVEAYQEIMRMQV